MDRPSGTFGQLVRDYATGPDGQTYAIGRGFAFILFLVGIAIPVVIAVLKARDGAPMADWVAFVGSLVAYYPALGAAVMALVWGTNSTEPKAPDPAPRPKDDGK